MFFFFHGSEGIRPETRWLTAVKRQLGSYQEMRMETSPWEKTHRLVPGAIKVDVLKITVYICWLTPSWSVAWELLISFIYSAHPSLCSHPSPPRVRLLAVKHKPHVASVLSPGSVSSYEEFLPWQTTSMPGEVERDEDIHCSWDQRRGTRSVFYSDIKSQRSRPLSLNNVTEKANGCFCFTILTFSRREKWSEQPGQQ